MPQDIWLLCVTWKCGENSSSAPMLGMTEWPGTLQSGRGMLVGMWAWSTLAWEAWLLQSRKAGGSEVDGGTYGIKKRWWCSTWHRVQLGTSLPSGSVNAKNLCVLKDWTNLRQSSLLITKYVESCWGSPWAANGWRLGDCRRRGRKEYQLCLSCLLLFPWPLLLATGDDR